MTGDDVIKLMVAPLITIIGAAIAWLIAAVLNCRERLVALEGKVIKLEGDIAQQVTVECVREAIKEALVEWDKQRDALNQEAEKRRQLEVREAVRDEIARTIPLLAKELRGT